MKQFVVCIVVLSLCYSKGQMYGGDWMAGLFGNINRMNRDIQQNVMSLNQQIQENVNQQVSQLTEGIRQAAAEGKLQQQGISVGVNGGSVIYSSVPGTSRTTISGLDAEGRLFYRDTEETVVGDTLHHTERIRYPVRGTTNEFTYTLNLTDPTARPVFQNN